MVVVAPAPAASSVTLAGMSTTVQCQKPDGVGASGSKQVTVKLRVPAGKPDQLSCGETLSPPAEPCACRTGLASPSATSALVSVKDGTSGSRSYGNGASGRSSVMDSSS